MANPIKYVKESAAEMKHVSWPTKSQVTSYTIVVIVISLLIAAFLGLFDEIFLNLVNFLIK